MNPQLFKRLILLWWGMAIFLGIVTAVSQAYLPPELQNYLNSEAEKELEIFDYVMLGFSIVMSVVLIVASFGLYSFRPWARSLFLGASIVLALSGLVFGPSVMSEWTGLVIHFDTILLGGLLFTMYLPPIATLFEQNETDADNRT